MSDLVVLCYHAVSDRWPVNLAVTSERLREHLEFFVARGYRGATFSDAVGGPRDADTVVVTFDDAFASVGDVAAPILADLGLPGTVLAVSDFSATGRALHWPGIDQWQEGPHAAELACLNWERLGELSEAGWEIGSHTVSHPHLTSLSDEALRQELLDSRRACERALSQPCRSIAYPYGDVNDRVVAATGAAGYEFGAALSRIHFRLGPLRWPRVGVYRDDTLSRLNRKVSIGRRSAPSSRWKVAGPVARARPPR